MSFGIRQWLGFDFRATNYCLAIVWTWSWLISDFDYRRHHHNWKASIWLMQPPNSSCQSASCLASCPARRDWCHTDSYQFHLFRDSNGFAKSDSFASYLTMCLMLGFPLQVAPGLRSEIFHLDFVLVTLWQASGSNFPQQLSNLNDWQSID